MVSSKWPLKLEEVCTLRCMKRDQRWKNTHQASKAPKSFHLGSIHQ